MDAVVVVESTEDVVELVDVEAVVEVVVELVLTGPGKYVVVLKVVQDQVVRSEQVFHQGHQVVLVVSVTASLHQDDSALAFTFSRYSRLYPTWWPL